MKALLFRITIITIAIFFFFIQIEIGKFDAIMATVSLVFLFIFIIDFASKTESFDTPYENTEYGSITWLLFGKKNKKDN